MKIAPLWRALSSAPWCEAKIVHSGQHSDPGMSDVFFRDLGLPEPHHFLGVGGSTHAETTARVMVAYERLCLERRPDWVVVVGDVNSTVAAALAAKKLNIKVAHLEAGLRSGDRTMPEEINRIVTDSISDLLWTPSPDGDENLAREGVPADRIERVGNIMIDSLEAQRSTIETANLPAGLEPRRYGLVTLHRPANVDDPESLRILVSALAGVAGSYPIVFPVHPRTRNALAKTGLLEQLNAAEGIRMMEPLGYIQFMRLLFSARFIVTDSGGVQEEATHVSVPCLTLRDTTERPVTVTHGTNRLVTPARLAEALDKVLSAPLASCPAVALWDGRTAERCAASLYRNLHRAPR
jgi:UDP-N-acetylglucosamine 2-epimerase (non-hydrolysing)